MYFWYPTVLYFILLYTLERMLLCLYTLPCFIATASLYYVSFILYSTLQSILVRSVLFILYSSLHNFIVCAFV